jgi:hypothetical protein
LVTRGKFRTGECVGSHRASVVRKHRRQRGGSPDSGGAPLRAADSHPEISRLTIGVQHVLAASLRETQIAVAVRARVPGRGACNFDAVDRGTCFEPLYLDSKRPARCIRSPTTRGRAPQERWPQDSPANTQKSNCPFRFFGARVSSPADVRRSAPGRSSGRRGPTRQTYARCAISEMSQSYRPSLPLA